MTVLSAQSIRARWDMLVPMVERTVHLETGCSYGLSSCGYDVRLDQDVVVPVGRCVLASTMEQFTMPQDLVGSVHDKSTWARRGLAVQNTIIEPGWRGFLTLELSNHGVSPFRLGAGTPIAQVMFHLLDQPTVQPYPERGKYMDQERGPVGARRESV